VKAAAILEIIIMQSLCTVELTDFYIYDIHSDFLDKFQNPINTSLVLTLHVSEISLKSTHKF